MDREWARYIFLFTKDASSNQVIIRPKEKDLAMELSSIALGSCLILLPLQKIVRVQSLFFAKKWGCDKDLMQDLLVLIYLSLTNQLSPNWIHWSTFILASVFQLWSGVLI
jgi:hypothetical protein